MKDKSILITVGVLVGVAIFAGGCGKPTDSAGIQGKEPANVMDFSPLPAVTKDDVAAYEQNWNKWLRQQ